MGSSASSHVREHHPSGHPIESSGHPLSALPPPHAGVFDSNYISGTGYAYGGAVSTTSATTSIKGCTFQYNQVVVTGAGTVASGAAVYVAQTSYALSIEFTSCNFISNSVTYTTSATTPAGAGGAVTLSGSSPTFQFGATFTSCLFSRNTVQTSASSTSAAASFVARGGAVYCNYCNATLTLCQFYQNNASVNTGASLIGQAVGGGISVANTGALTVKSCIFWQNSVKSASVSYGGAMHVYNFKGFVTIRNSSLVQNTALANGTAANIAAGGAIRISTVTGAGITTVTGTTFTQNKALVTQTTYSGAVTACKEALGDMRRSASCIRHELGGAVPCHVPELCLSGDPSPPPY